MIAFASLFLGLVAGVLPVSVIVSAPVARVEFLLDGRPAGRVSEKPWSVAIDLGEQLEPHELVARAFDEKGREIGRARQWLNLPRPPAEVEIVLERDRTGRATAAHLAWASLTAPRPARISLTLDGRPLSVSGSRRAALPGYDASTTHVLSAEVEFATGVRSRSDVVLGGGSAGDAKSELTAVALRLRTEHESVTAEAGRPALSKKGQPMTVAAVDHGPADVLIVRDPGSEEALLRLGRAGPLRDFRLDKQDAVRIVWPMARSADLSEQERTELLDTTRYLTARESGFYFLLTAIRYVEGYDSPRRFADAVAVAGLQAYGSRSRRAVVLVLGGSRPDNSRYAPAQVLRYLERIHVPLHVWCLEGVGANCPSQWGEREDVSSLSRLREAVTRLKGDLETQQVVWLEGKHLPQDIELSDRAPGVEFAR